MGVGAGARGLKEVNLKKKKNPNLRKIWFF